ncbi:hypothetical protein NAEGRDRAFT_80126 [Naegleria gruberi]|uniref:F-box domain-containing protein n=1 Tax=Naegleria gruberi TaxID=5762 RepID=D2VIY3_NAEGR|nr:uncharacterized protein NAEGRDRAFT_80126 [Naegleria gruberi]EFC43182.1 hypothetical protein NAEGRDRAFT_80126 [Naegleria gruberi]|eukprot:XP_002675926.1 hypothetical protein NAEGRDRAFT_80126 [Naegleria gruberi strain NEG-M]
MAQLETEIHLAETSSVPTSSWEDLPMEIFYEILSFLPMLPFFFKLSRVNRTWNEILNYLMERAASDPRYNLHLNFGYINPSKMEYTDLLKILDRCRGVRRITLCNMTVTNEIVRAIELTQVETLVISQCEFITDWDSRGGFSQYWLPQIILNFDKIENDTRNRYVYSRFSSRTKSSQNNFRAFTELVEKTVTPTMKKLEKLKNVIVFDCQNGCNFYIQGALLSHYLENYDKIDFCNIVLGEKVDIITKDPLPKVSSISFRDREPIKILVVKSQQKFQCSLAYKNLGDADIGESSKDIFDFLKRNDLINGYDPGKLLENIPFSDFIKGVEMGLFTLFSNGKSIILEKLEALSEISPRLDPTIVECFKNSSFTESSTFKFVTELLEWIHKTPSAKEDLFEQHKPIYKSCVKVCKDIDKRFKYYQTKTKSNEEFIMWAFFLESGQLIKKSTKRKAEEPSTKNKKSKK